MRRLLIAAAVTGFCGVSAARAEPVMLDENGLGAVVAAGAIASTPTLSSMGTPGPVQVSVPVNVSSPVNVASQVDVTNQVATAAVVGVTAAVAAFSNNVVASGGATSTLGIGTVP